jgi:hypothetical protein
MMATITVTTCTRMHDPSTASVLPRHVTVTIST